MVASEEGSGGRVTLFRLISYEGEKEEWGGGRVEEWGRGRVEEWEVERWGGGRVEEWGRGRVEEWEVERWGGGRVEEWGGGEEGGGGMGKREGSEIGQVVRWEGKAGR